MAFKKKEKAKKKARVISSIPQTTSPNDIKMIVAIGASAGGLEALEIFFKCMPPDTGITFVIIMHLMRDRPTILSEVLQRFTPLNVTLVQEKERIQANHVYVLPPAKNIQIKEGYLQLVEQEPTREIKLPIDFFLRSLATDQGPKSTCIILSGLGGDGSIGLRAIREKGGLVMVQAPQSAAHDGMPKSAINTGLIDYILPPEKMPNCLLNYLAYMEDQSLPLENRIPNEIKRALNLLKDHTGHDFSLYKPNTIFRRIQKRMNIQQYDNLAEYIQALHRSPEELEVLFKELLINVTNFFRDADAFALLKQILLERILKDKPKESPLRVWVPGCSTGEEAYSIAILLQECMDTLRRHFPVQIFGTDIDEEAIEVARAGIYPTNIALDVSPERLKRFFTEEEKFYKVNNDIRKMIIFATQNIIKDPPFTRLDLLSCRNLLIYLSSELQKKVLPLFHYSLKRKGILFLGSSETVGSSVDLFNIIDRRWKLFERREGISSFQTVLDFPSASLPPKLNEATEIMEKKMQSNEHKLAVIIENVLLNNYAPACVMIDEEDNIIYVHGRTSKYLEFASGEAHLNLLEMLRPELKPKVVSALRKARTQQKEIIYGSLQLKEGEDFIHINLRIKPLTEPELAARKLLLVIFEEVVALEKAGDKPINKRGTKSQLDKKNSLLEQELKYTKESLQTTIEELETSNEELKSSNEELQSTNEELQSTNEEIETSKEELQSLNEELTTVNAELESRIEQLSSANDDIRNLLDNTEIATIFLDKDLCIKRFTPKATEIINLISSDVGRPISHIVSNLRYEKLVEDAKTVLKTLTPKTADVEDNGGHWYTIRIIPYRTLANFIDGVVITFLNIHAQKNAEEKLKQLTKALHETQLSHHSLLQTLAIFIKYAKSS